jgi:hypothetical protein
MFQKLTNTKPETVKAMVKTQRHQIKQVDKEKSNGLRMHTRPHIFRENSTHKPTRSDLNFALPAIFCFYACRQFNSVASANHSKFTLQLATQVHFYQRSNWLQQ